MIKYILFLYIVFYILFGCATPSFVKIGITYEDIKNEELVCMDLTEDYQKTLTNEKILKILCIGLTEEHQRALNYHTTGFSINGFQNTMKSPENFLSKILSLRFKEEYQEALNNQKLLKISDQKEEREFEKAIEGLPEDYSNEVIVEPIVKDSEWIFSVNK
ncbi:MAG: hypothetical protein AABZ60_13195, partial [Planctomycetota bacterium]